MRKFDFDRFFDSFFESPGFLPSPRYCIPKEGFFRSPATDIWEEDGKIKTRIDLPGVDKKDIDIRVHDNTVEIKAEKKFENKQEGKDFFRQERCFAGFYKSFTLPHKVDSQKLEAEYKDGVLEIEAPKTEEETKKIEVK